MLVRRADNEDPVAQERLALAGQRAELESLKRQLADRVAAVREREEELRAAIARVAAGKEPAIALPQRVDPDSDRLATRAAALGERERAVAAREAALAAGTAHRAAWDPSGNGAAGQAERAAELETRSRELERRMAELDARERALAEQERIPPDPDAARLAEIEERLEELRTAEAAFLRTRRELADHSDAIAAREQLLAQRERELDEREDGRSGPDILELESRLRRLETQRTAGEQTRSFSGGFRKLEQDGTRRPPSG